ncbi:ribonuclease H-like domain-containing protein [Tanacetum coccineum]
MSNNEFVKESDNVSTIKKFDHFEVEVETKPSNLSPDDEEEGSHEASKDVNWINVMNEEMHALYENKTWIMTDLPVERKPIGSKWVFRIKYKSNGEVERYKVRLVAKGFDQKEVQEDWKIYQIDVNNAFLYGDLKEEVYMLPPPGLFSQHMHAPLKSHFDIALRVLKYLKLAPGLGIEFTKKKSDCVISAFSDFDWAKCPVTRRSVSGYYVFINGNLVS